MTSWKNRLRRMLFLHKLEPLVSQTPKVAEVGAKSATGNARLSPPVQLPHTSWTDVRSPRLSALSTLQAVRSAFNLHLRLGGANGHFGSSIISAAPASSFCERSTSRDSWIDT